MLYAFTHGTDDDDFGWWIDKWEGGCKLHTAADLGGNPTAVLCPPSFHLLFLLLLLLLLLLPLLFLLLLLLFSPPLASCCSLPGARAASSLMEGEVNPHTSLAATFYKKIFNLPGFMKPNCGLTGKSSHMSSQTGSSKMVTKLSPSHIS